MHGQTELFDPPIARQTDPDTSKIAAASYSESKLGEDEQTIFNLVSRAPGHTAGEYSRILKNEEGVDWYRAARMTTKRISGLLTKEKIVVGETRKCGKTGNRARTYYVKGSQQ